MKQIAKLKDDARKHEAREEWIEAIQAYAQVLQLGEAGDGADHDLPLYNRVGDLYVRLGRAAEAVKYYEQAADKYAEAGLYNNAIALCNKALRYDAGRVELLKKLGQFSASQGFFTDARRWYLEYCERMSKRGAMDQAFEALSELADVHNDPEIRELLARQLKEHGRPEQALREYQRAYHLHKSRGQSAEAEAIRAEIHAIDPGVDLAQGAAPAADQHASIYEELPGFDEPGIAVHEPPPVAAVNHIEAPVEVAFDGPVEESTLDLATIELEPTTQAFGQETAPTDFGQIDLEMPATLPIDFDMEPLDIGIEPSLEFAPPAEEPVEESLVESSLVEPSAESLEEEDELFELPTFDLEDGAVEVIEEPPLELPTFEEFDVPQSAEPLPGIDDYEAQPVDAQPAVEEPVGPLPLSFEYVDELLTEAETEPSAAEEILPDLNSGFTLRPPDQELPAPVFEHEVPGPELEAPPEPPPVREPVTLVEPQRMAASPPAPAAAPAHRSQPQYVDLAAFLLDEEAPVETTRFVVTEHAPTGDEERDFADMLKQFKAKVAETIPKEDAGSHYDLGLAFKEMGLIDEAIAEFQTALRGGEEKLKVYEELGNCFVQKQQYSVAVTILTRAAQMPHSDESELLGVYYNLGRAHEELGQFLEARSAFERVISVDIGFMDTSQRLAKL